MDSKDEKHYNKVVKRLEKQRNQAFNDYISVPIESKSFAYSKMVWTSLGVLIRDLKIKKLEENDKQ